MSWAGPFLPDFLNKTLLSKPILLPICTFLCHMACLPYKFLRRYLRSLRFIYRSHAVFHWQMSLCTVFLICYSGCSWWQVPRFLQVCHSSTLLYNFPLLCWSKVHCHAAILSAIRLCKALHCTIASIPLRFFCSRGKFPCRCRLLWSILLWLSSCSSIGLRNNVRLEKEDRLRFLSCPPFLLRRPNACRIILNKNCFLINF